MKKKILIISYSYPPANEPATQRPYAVAKYLDKEKFEVTVLTCSNPDSSLGFNKDFDEELPDVKLFKVKSLVGSGIANVLRKDKMSQKTNLKQKVKAFMFNLFSTMVIPDKGIFWYFPVKRFLHQNRALIYNTDIVFTTSPAFSNHLVGRFLKNKNKSIIWISELRDFHYLERHQRTNIKSYIDGKLEQMLLKRSSRISFISYAMKEIYQRQYTAFSDKMNVIYNGFDLSDFENLEITSTSNKKLTIFYAGSFYRGVRSPIPLLSIVDRLIENGSILPEEITIKIAGNFETELLDEVKKYKSFPCIDFLGNIPRKEVLNYLVVSDLLWLIVGNKPTHYTGVPIKFFEYLAARRPIINFAPAVSEPSRIINLNNLGWNFDTFEFNLEQNTLLFEGILKRYKSGELSLSLPLQSFPEFDRKEQGKVFGELFLEK